MRTKGEILQDFENLGYTTIFFKKEHCIEMKNNDIYLTVYMGEIKGVYKYYRMDFVSKIAEIITLEEHKLIHELFELWGWIE